MAAGAASALFILDIKGRVLVWRDYRGDVSSLQAERFFTNYIQTQGDSDTQDPVVYHNGVTYMFIQHNNVYLMIATRQNCNAASLLLFLHRLVDVFKHYFEELEEESLRDNFVVVYELLDEMMDFGYPQFTEANILSEFIKTDAYRMEVSQKPPMAVTNAVSWRSEGINYKKNEVFLDVVENVNILVNSNGQIIRSEVVGALKMRTYLSGMPECKLGLNDRVLLEAQGRTTKGKAIDLDDIKFHQCVRLARFENDRTISFVPPDGAFDLMTYRLSTQVKPLIWVEAHVERHSKSRVEITVKARSQFKERRCHRSKELVQKPKIVKLISTQCSRWFACCTLPTSAPYPQASTCEVEGYTLRPRSCHSHQSINRHAQELDHIASLTFHFFFTKAKYDLGKLAVYIHISEAVNFIPKSH
ncbi:AP complex, mu/sigma subunit [Artemisia annua]|uniref:AP complex, mu/sigma subunit n=1 Tax=Artemisia annua TaxID=35608 RepID=A0A2U1QC45_ARTAN|nr:AP complex, mu/sigma subunit [Artemisia annua]